tara:strand:- start:5190 stop:5762 length:573 start_codon:yes stop_codon:yes gene_type:complete
MRITNRDGVEMNVNANHQAETHSTTIKEIQWFSRHKRTAYSAWGRTDTLSAAKVPVLYIKNTSSDKDLIIYKANFQTIAEAATTPAVGIYWSVDLGSVCSGGTAMTPINLNTGSSNAAEVTALQSTPTIGTTGTETARIYPGVDGTLLSVDDGESIVVAPNGSWLLNYTTTGTAGIASALVFFYMKDVVG